MTILALTTSTDRGSVALLRKNKFVAAKSWTRSTPHSEILTLHIQGMLSRARVKPAELDIIAVDCGPGSFTGARMAVNVAKTLAYSTGAKVYSLPSLDIMAESVASKHSGKIVALLDAHRSLFYFQWYESDGEKIVNRSPTITAVPWNIVQSHLTAGTKIVGEAPGGDSGFPDAKTLALSASRHQIHEDSTLVDWTNVYPLYVRSPDVLEKLK